jgi:c-di-GMP-binding flagellar brake protein YcgR
MLKGLIGGFKSLVSAAGGGGSADFGERRKLVRLRCHYDVMVQQVEEGQKKVQGQKKFKGIVVEMGLEGMRLRCFEPVKKGLLIDVHYVVPILSAEVSTVRCEVVWSRQREKDFVTFVGVRYVSDKKDMARSWVKALLHELGFKPELIHQKRRNFRADCFIPAYYVTRAGESYQSKLYNLGITGALLEAGKDLPKGEVLDLRIGPYESLAMFAVQANVVQCRRQPGSRLYQAGVNFQELNNRHMKSLTDYLKLLMAESWSE